MMFGQLKDGPFAIGWGRYFSTPMNKDVFITDTEDHPIFGKRYKITGYNEWFEVNCFKWVKEEEGE